MSVSPDTIDVTLPGPWLAAHTERARNSTVEVRRQAGALDAVHAWLEGTTDAPRPDYTTAWNLFPASAQRWAALRRKSWRHSPSGVTVTCDGVGDNNLCFHDAAVRSSFTVTIAPFLAAWAPGIRTPADAARWWGVLLSPGVCRGEAAIEVLSHPEASGAWRAIPPVVVRRLLSAADPRIRATAITHLAETPAVATPPARAATRRAASRPV